MPTFDPIFAKDPGNPNNIAANATITLFDPADPSKSPILLTRVDGSPLPNPYTVDRQGMGPAFVHETLFRVGWEGGGLSNFFTSYEAMHEEAMAARTAAEAAVPLAQDAQAAALAAADNAAPAAAEAAAAAAETALAARVAAGEFKGDPGRDGSNVLPTSQAIAQEITTQGSPANAALSATIASATADKVSAAQVGSQIAAAGYTREFWWDGNTYQPADQLGVGGTPRNFTGPTDPTTVPGFTPSVLDKWFVTPAPPDVTQDGLIARFRADELNLAPGATVTSWPALTGAYTLTAGGAPVYKKDTGLSYIETDGVDDYLESTALVRAQPNSIVVVGSYWGTVTSNRTLVDTTASPIQTIGIASSGTGRVIYAGKIATYGVNEDANWHTHVVSYNGASSRHSVDGVAGAGTDPSTLGAQGLRIGRSNSGTVYTRLRVAEILVYNRALTAAEHTEITDILRGYHGLA